MQNQNRTQSFLGFSVGFLLTVVVFALLGSGCGEATPLDRVGADDDELEPLFVPTESEQGATGEEPDAQQPDAHPPSDPQPGDQQPGDQQPVPFDHQDRDEVTFQADGPELDEPTASEPTEADLAELEEAFPVPPSTYQPEFGGGEDPAPVISTEWTWYGEEFFTYAPVCMDGSATGMAVSPSPSSEAEGGSDKTLIFFQSGGACFNGTTCLLSDYWLTNDHFDDQSFEDWMLKVGQFRLFDREDEDNPYRDYNFVFFPYCSGDVFGGRNFDGPGGRAHVGYRNVGAYMDFLGEYYGDTTAWTVSGSSAGGFGAAYNFSRIQKDVAPAPVTLVSDSAPVFSNQYATSCLQEKWKNAWSLDETYPDEFMGQIGYDGWGTGEGLSELLRSVIEEHPNNQFAFVAGDEDTVLRFFYGIGHSWGCNLPWLMSKSKYRRAVQEFRDEVVGEYDNVSVYTVHTSDHTFLNSNRMYSTSVSGWSLTDWLSWVEAGEAPGSWW